MNEYLKIIANPYEWPPPVDDWEAYEGGDVYEIILFLGFIAFVFIVYYLVRFISAYIHERKLRKWRKEMHMDRIDELIAQHYKKEMMRSQKINK